METAKHLIIAIITASLLILCGTLGYMAIEGLRALDALYMTVIKLATVGYGEVHPVSDAGHIYAIVLIITGVGFFLYVAGAVIQFMVEGRVHILMGRRRLDNLGFKYVCDDATDEVTLLKAWIKKAWAIIAVLGTDTGNVFLVLSAL